MLKEKFKKLNSKFEPYYLWLILILAAVLRLRNLAYRDFWYDEAFTGVAVKEKFSDMIQMIINDVHPPLYYASLKLFASFFDYSVYGIRLFSAIFGILAVWAAYLFAKELCGKRAGLFAGFITAIAPFAIQYSQEARMYTMLSFFLLISAYFFLRALKNNSTKNYVFWGIFLGLACLTHYMGVVFSATFYLAYLVWNIFEEEETNKKFDLRSLKKFIPNKSVLIGYFFAFLVFSFWVKRFYYHMMDLGDNLHWVRPANLGDVFWSVQMFLFGTPVGEMSSGMPNPNTFYIISQTSVLSGLTILFTAIIIFLFFRDRKKTATLLVFSFGFIGIVYIMSLFNEQYFVARYLMPAAYFIYILLGVWLSQVHWRYVASALALYGILLAFVTHLGFSTGWNILQKNTAKYKDSDFYITTSFDYVIAKYYLGADRLTLYNLDWPAYNPSYWAAIGPSLKRAESFNTILNDPNALIISNMPLNKKTSTDPTFDAKKFKLVDYYNNIFVYKIDPGSSNP
ncbi:MAG: glycosyltransferase family 39 protein [Parcubacteria group bacterium]|jgi:uncharacterized membrane protein